MSKDKQDTEQVVVGSHEWLELLFAKRYTKEWQKDILALLDKDEFIENYPSTDGLARVAGLIFGEFQVNVNVIKSPSVGDRSATVQVEILRVGGQKFSSAADVSEINTKKPYCLHPVATAETKAYGRALKKMLGIKVHTHEEMLDDETSYEKLTEQQVRAVENVAKKLNVNLDSFLAEHAGVSLDAFKSGSGLTKDHGMKLLNKLNEIQNAK